MATQVQTRRGTTAQHSTFTGAVGEVTVDTDKEVVVVHDGSTAGGYPQMRENGSNSALALGSASTPSLKFAGDTNTGIYSPGADQVAISTNSVGRLFVDASGRVLSGTSSSSADVNAIFQGTSAGSSGAGILIAARGTTTPNNGQALGILRFSDAGHITAADIRSDRDGGTWTSGSSQPSRITFSTTPDGSATIQERLRITSAGLVGIGTSSPGTLLDVVNGTGRIRTGGKAGSNAYLKLESTDASNSMELQFSNSTNTSWSIQSVENGISNRALALNPAGGNVGIGNTTPVGRLSVETASATDPGTVVTAGWDSSYVLIGDSDNTNGANLGLGFRTGGITSGFGTQIVSLDPNADWYPINYHGNLHVWYGGATERARIDTSGRLLVGTSTTSGVARTVIQGYVGDNNGLGLLQLQVGSTSPGFTLGRIDFTDSNSNAGARFLAERDGGTWTSGSSHPTRLVFSTTADGASSPTERMRISSTGAVTCSSTISDVSGNVRAIPQNAQTTAYTLVASDAGKHVDITTGGVTVPSGVFGFGDAVTIYNDSTSNQTITQGASVTLRQAGTANTGNRTLAQYGVATLLCVGTNTFVITGAGLS